MCITSSGYQRAFYCSSVEPSPMRCHCSSWRFLLIAKVSSNPTGTSATCFQHIPLFLKLSIWIKAGLRSRGAFFAVKISSLNRKRHNSRNGSHCTTPDHDAVHPSPHTRSNHPTIAAIAPSYPVASSVVFFLCVNLPGASGGRRKAIVDRLRSSNPVLRTPS